MEPVPLCFQMHGLIAYNLLLAFPCPAFGVGFSHIGHCCFSADIKIELLQGVDPSW